MDGTHSFHFHVKQKHKQLVHHLFQLPLTITAIFFFSLQVLVYHKAFPMPALSFQFDAPDLLSGHNSDKTAKFVSSVCWQGQSSTLVAANSSGNIKILEMI